MFSKMPIVLIILIGGIIWLNPYIPLFIQQILYAISLSIKSGIIFVLPYVIFGLLFKAALNLSNSATRIIGLILGGVCVSSFVSLFFSHFIGEWVYSFDLSLIIPKNTEAADAGLKAAWLWEISPLVPNARAMFAGLILGILAGLFKIPQAVKVSAFFDKTITVILKGITFLIPLFVAGFMVKLQADDVIHIILKDYAIIFMIIAISQFSYIFFAYFLLNGGRVRDFMSNLKDMMPAAISGFCTMSSAATMPLTIIGAENNVKNKSLVESVIPATVNIHLVGDCFATPILAYAVLKNFGLDEPSLINYVIFAAYFVLAKFSVAAIPGGGILVMLPILEIYLGFTGEMMSLITALYILFDPVITCANVLGNGAFAKIIDHILTYFQRKKQIC